MKCIKLLNIAVKYLFSWILRKMPTKYLRVFTLKILGASIGKKVNINADIYLHMETLESSFKNLVVGNNVYIGPKVFLDLSGPIIIGDNATISMNCCILTHQDPGETKSRPIAKYYPKKIKSVRISEGAYIGANATLLPGITIGKMSVVGAGAIVVDDVPDSVVVAGVPARIIKTLDSDS